MSISTGVAVGAAIAAANASNGASGHTELSQGGAALLLAILAVSVAVGAIVGSENYASDRELGHIRSGRTQLPSSSCCCCFCSSGCLAGRSASDK